MESVEHKFWGWMQINDFARETGKVDGDTVCCEGLDNDMCIAVAYHPNCKKDGPIGWRNLKLLASGLKTRCEETARAYAKA